MRFDILKEWEKFWKFGDGCLRSCPDVLATPGKGNAGLGDGKEVKIVTAVTNNGTVFRGDTKCGTEGSQLFNFYDSLFPTHGNVGEVVLFTEVWSGVS